MIKYFQREWDKLSKNILKEYVISNNMKFPKEFLYICWKHRRLSEKKINTYFFVIFIMAVTVKLGESRIKKLTACIKVVS